MEHMAARMDDQITGAISENERLRQELLDVWAAIGATDVGQGLAWNVAAMVRLSRERRDELDALRATLEIERMRLAACSTAALGYWKGGAQEYDSAALQDVLRLYTKAYPHSADGNGR